jgi:predicted metal-dependent HD superfamily phosphohydrolase
MTEGEGVVEELVERWQDLTSYVTEEVRKRWWEKIVAAYSEPHRKYHTLYHIYQMFQHYDQNKVRKVFLKLVYC